MFFRFSTLPDRLKVFFPTVVNFFGIDLHKFSYLLLVDFRSEMASTSPTMNKIERAHQMYREGKYGEALEYYTDALSMAKTSPQKIALHSNRAACYLKLHDFTKVCTA